MPQFLSQQRCLFHLFITCLITWTIGGCMKAQKADLIVHNAVIHSMDDKLTIYEAMAIKDGKIIELGPQQQILNKYSAGHIIDAQSKTIYPGFTDAHIHLILGAKQRLQLDLSACTSLDHMLLTLEMYQQKHHKDIIVARGWNEQTWTDQRFPDNSQLNELFPDTPVCLFRHDEHTALVNQAMLEQFQINEQTDIEGGSIASFNGKPTGILTDNALDILREVIPQPSAVAIADKIIEIQNDLLQYGITNVHDAGIERSDIDMYQRLIDEGRLHLNIYAMLLANDSTIDFARKHGIYTHKNLSVRSFKLFADGALGSHGAWLKEPYFDRPTTSGLSTISSDKMQQIAKLCVEIGYQLNTHAIGDAAVKMTLDAYKIAQQTSADHRWRIEHAQVVDPQDISLFAQYGIIPSVQPTHALSDVQFAQLRLGDTRFATSYAYRSLLEATGMIVLGTDFPVEDYNPFATIHAACKRKNTKDAPKNGVLPQQAITLNDCLKGMTHWACVASFQEEHIGQLTNGMDATFAIFDRKINVPPTFQQNFALYTYIKGKKVYDATL